ncbi:DUF927 domain-containing protein [Bilophila wadsworthia]|uniref:DUF927 domain-containing protein n=1 Tax=Bilophila wadsworthia TaxID=35833 RepID=UPI002A841324|nr:DUF927 domain-containing protein [Bilophila wadsworthia]MDY3682843.1 DUF927 domain-containing protein [Bilophila wadsworthia]
MSSDILQHFADRLREVGLVVDRIEADGLLHRCGVSGKEQGTDGAYKAFLDAPASIWWKNWRTGDEGTWCGVSNSDMTTAEREALKARIAEAKEAAAKEQAERWAKAAELAGKLWEAAHAATDDHPYLQRKEVPAFGLKQAQDGRLMVPVLDAAGLPQSLQFIAGDGSKRFLSGGKTEGGYFPVSAKDGSKDGPLLIVEGYATAASLRIATGYAVLVAFNAGNLEAVACMARKQYPDREIILCADNDVETRKPDGTPWNTGVEAASKAAASIGVKLAICPAHEGRATDFNDLHTRRSLEAVRQAVDAARREDPGVKYPEGYRVIQGGKNPGLYRDEKRGEDFEPMRIAPPLRILGRTKSVGFDNWGTLLQWFDPAGKEHRYALPDDVLQRQGNDWAAALAYQGYSIRRGKANAFAVFIQELQTTKFVTCTARVGWHGSAYVMPDTVYGADKGSLVLQGGGHEGLYTTSGTRESWEELARLCVGNTRLVFALCAAFAGPLLRLADVEGGGFSFEGGSSCGKTTCLQVAASVWGGPAHMRPWRATDNGLESVCVLHNDNLLILDEVGQVSANVLSECGYLIANGIGKTRSGKDSALRKSHTWRLLFLSSGEIGFAEKLSERGLKARAGQEVRFVGIPTDAGMMSELHGLPDAGALSNRLKELAGQHYGHAGRAFLQWLTDNRQDIADGVGESLTTGENRLCPPDATEQVRRVARRFCLVAYAGKLTQLAGVIPPEMDVEAAVRSCFNDWLEVRGGAGAGEDAAILSAVRLFIEQHGASRFQDMDNPAATCINRVGFRRATGSGIEYAILPESFKSEVVKGYSERRAARVLTNAGWLERGPQGRMKTRRALPGIGRQACYVLTIPEDEEPTD